MYKIVLLLTLLGLVSQSQISFGQTLYTGIANVQCSQNSFPPNCGFNGFGKVIGNIRYTVIYRSGLPDSIIYEILNSCSSSSLQFNGNSTQITYLKNDADSIVFNFGFHFFDDTHGCKQFEDDNGIARISKSTAGIATKENGVLDFQLFPNPTNGLLKIKSTANKATVIDNLGRISISQKFESLNSIEFNTLDVSSLRSGCYTLILDEGIKKMTTKFIKY